MHTAVAREIRCQAVQIQCRVQDGPGIHGQCGMRASWPDWTSASSRANLLDALSFTLSLLSWPQAAMMSRPRGRAHRRGIAGAIDDFGEFLDLAPVGTFIRRAGPGIEGDQVDLGGNAR